MSYTLPSEVDARPVAVVGAGILGRRIAAMFAAGGTDCTHLRPVILLCQSCHS
jgi:3-hydroxyacyl-CoA dehydrogenase